MNHTYSSDERAQLKQFQSIDYLAPSSRVYRAWLAQQPWSRYWDRWLMMVGGARMGQVATRRGEASAAAVLAVNA